MDLVRELKALNAKKKAGETLAPAEESRRKELKSFLKSQLEGGEGSTSPPAAAGAAARPAGPTTDPATTPNPRPAQAAAGVRTQTTPAAQAGSVLPAAHFTTDADALIAAALGETRSAARPAAGRPIAAADFNEFEPPSSPDAIADWLRTSQGAYTEPIENIVSEQYYGGYFDEGLALATAVEAGDIRPVDPREIELRRAGIADRPGGGSTSVTVPPGLAFLDDYAALYARRVLPPPSDAVEAADGDPDLLVARRKVTVHMLNGEKKQGSVRAFRRGEMGFRLESPTGNEVIGITQIRALFVHLQPNAQAPAAEGRTLTVVFQDQRAVQGVTSDYQPGAAFFTLTPPGGRGQFERIIVNPAAVSRIG